MKKQLLSLQRSWIITDKQINTEHEIVLGRIQLLLGGQADLSVEVHVLSVLCVIRGKAFTLSLLRCQSGPSMHATVGGVGIRGEQGLAFACGTKKPTTQHGAPPPPRPFTLSQPYRSPTPPSLSLGAGCSSSSLSEVCMAEQWAFYPHEKPGMCLNVAGPGPSLLSVHALCPLFPPREKQ